MNRTRFHALTLVGVVLTMASSLSVAVGQDATSESEPRDVRFYSDHVACHGRIFFPTGFRRDGQSPAVVVAPGWTETADVVEPYARRLAESGFVAMTLDYRGWGKSGGFVTQAERVLTDDRMRFIPLTMKVRIKRTRLIPEAQVEDIRNAMSFLQGEPGVDPNRIGLWGTGLAGGHVISVASRDARLKVGVCQIPWIAGKDAPGEAFRLEGDLLRDAIQRARTGQGTLMQIDSDGNRVTVDAETRQAVREYLPFRDLVAIDPQVALLFIVAADDTVVDNSQNAEAAAEMLQGQGNPTRLVDVVDANHRSISNGEHFETSAGESIRWFREHL